MDLALTTERGLDELLSRANPETLRSLSRLDGDVLVLGAAGKMGPTLARMVRRGFDELGLNRRVIGAARFSDSAGESWLNQWGVETVRCDLLDRDQVANLPDAPNVIYMAGQKFGTTGNPELTWAINTIAPANVAERYRDSRIVVFSTGCVYPNTPVSDGGSKEDDPLEPLGEYANACVARERIFGHYSGKNHTAMAILRLNYAIDLRYGVLVDVAKKVWEDQEIDLTTGFVNVIWQGDANAFAIRCLERAAVPPFVVNVTGAKAVSIREVAHRFGELLGRKPRFRRTEADTALLSNTEKMRSVFGEPEVSLDQMIRWVAARIQAGRPVWDKPTHYEVRDGRY